MPRDELTKELVQVRISGPPSSVELVAWKLRGLIGVRVLDESLDYPNREAGMVRRYMSLGVRGEGAE